MFLKAMMTVVLIFFMLGVAGAMGLRVHPEALSAQDPTGFIEVKFKGGGGSVIGKKTHEDAKEIHVNLDGGSTVFSKQEIEAVRNLDYKGIPEPERKAFQKTPFLTMRPEDSLFYTPPKEKPPTVMSPGHKAYEPKPPVEERVPSGDGMMGALQEMVAQQQEMTRYRQKMIEEYAEGIEGDYNDGSSRGSSYTPSEDKKSSSSGQVDSSIDSGFEFSMKSNNN